MTSLVYPTVAFRHSLDPVQYDVALQEMEERARAIVHGHLPELVWFLEHPPLYTGGTSARDEDMAHAPLPVMRTGRGGQVTYHGPGQRIAYVMLDLRLRGQDLRRYIFELEEWIIQALSLLNVKGERREGRVGIWVEQPGEREAKIAAIGVRVQKWVTLHGFALNVCPDLQYFSAIVPCGIKDYGVTSLHALGLDVGMEAVDGALKATFPQVFRAPLQGASVSSPEQL